MSEYRASTTQMPAPTIEKAAAAPVLPLLAAVVAAAAAEVVVAVVVAALSENDTTTTGTVATMRSHAVERVVVATMMCNAMEKEAVATVTFTATERADMATTIATVKAGTSLMWAVAIAITVIAGIATKVGTTRTGMVRTGRMPTAETTRQMVLLSQSPQNVRRAGGTVKSWCFTAWNLCR